MPMGNRVLKNCFVDSKGICCGPQEAADESKRTGRTSKEGDAEHG